MALSKAEKQEFAELIASAMQAALGVATPVAVEAPKAVSNPVVIKAVQTPKLPDWEPYETTDNVEADYVGFLEHIMAFNGAYVTAKGVYSKRDGSKLDGSVLNSYWNVPVIGLNLYQAFGEKFGLLTKEAREAAVTYATDNSEQWERTNRGYIVSRTNGFTKRTKRAL